MKDCVDQMFIKQKKSVIKEKFTIWKEAMLPELELKEKEDSSVVLI